MCWKFLIMQINTKYYKIIKGVTHLSWVLKKTIQIKVSGVEVLGEGWTITEENSWEAKQKTQTCYSWR